MKHILLTLCLFLVACATREPIVKAVKVDIPISVCAKPMLETPPKELTAAFDLAKPCQDAECAERVKAGLADREAWKKDALACRAQVNAIKPTVAQQP